MNAAKTFSDLLVWQKSHQMVLDVYRITATFPNHERYGLVAQASLEEARYYLLLACDLWYAGASTLPDLQQVSRLLQSYSRKVHESPFAQ